MKNLAAILLLLTALSSYSQIPNKSLNKSLSTMKMNTGIVTDKLAETKEFYTTVLGFGVIFENEFYLLMHTPNHQAEISFLQSNHPTQRPIFQQAFNGKGVYMTIEVENVDKLYEEIKAKNVPLEIDIRDEPWGDRHFAIVDPNGIGIDLVTYVKPAND